ncbi:MAG: LysM peptidoglycan-binding domain-containing protein [Lachnospiraceae bacterium]|nr:LysM peptidoglycan-binding domain-containing protein [Lachnospiraceae bacterium]
MNTYQNTYMHSNKKRKASNNRRVGSGILYFSTCILCIVVVFIASGIFSNAKSSSTESTYKYYTSITIKPGDTLYEIALEHYDEHYDSYREYIEEIRIINTLDEDSLTAGMSLIIPYYSAEFKTGH